jgi:P-type conjugative transfer protein TrbJ
MKKIILAAILSATSVHANAMIVFDPSNFTENLISAMQSVAMEARQASEYATQLQQYATQVKQVASLGSGAVDEQFNDIMNTYRTVTQYQSELAGLQGALGDVKSVMNNRMNLMAASGLSWDQYLQRERDSLSYRQNGNNILSAYERQTMDNAAQRYAQVQALQPQIMSTSGTHQSMQLMNTQMNMLTASMQDLIALSAAQGNQKQIEKNEEFSRIRAEQNDSDSYMRKNAQSGADSWNLINSMKNAK